MQTKELYSHNYAGDLPDDVLMQLPEAIGSLFHDFFSGARQEKLFWILTQTPQSIDGILSRQKATKDMMQYGPEKFQAYSDSMKELESRLRASNIVRIWKKDRQGRNMEPLVYDHKKLKECVCEFQTLCSQIVGSLENSKSDVFARLKGYFSKFIDPASKIVRKWESERAIMDKAGLPFFGLIDRDSWTREVKGMHPLGFISSEDSSKIGACIQETLKRGEKEFTLTFGGRSIVCQLVDMPGVDLKFKYERESGPKRYVDFDLFLDVTRYVDEALYVFNRLALYQHAAKMYSTLKEQNLPVCFPTIVPEGIIDVQDFYPLHARKRRGQYVFNSLRLDAQNPIALVTGLNSGGKSSLLHSMDSITGLARAGFALPASVATVGNFGETIHHEIVGGDIHGTSTFRGQTRDAVRFLQELNKPGLRFGLLDEAASGTDAATGKEAMDNLLQILAKIIKKPAIVVTHFTEAAEEVECSPKKYPGVKLYCYKMKGKNRPSYKLEKGVGASEGKYILEEEGLTLEGFLNRRKKK